jgi:hypothetical protein
MSAPFRIDRQHSLGFSEQGASATADFKAYLDRLMKLIPSEVVGLYLIGEGMIPSAERIGLVIWSVVCLVAVFCVRAFGTRDKDSGKSVQWAAVAITCVSFVIWLYCIGGPFQKFPGVRVPYIGSLLVLAWTFFVPLFYKGD